MRLLFVNRFYWPETPATGQLLTDLAEGLAARGHDVAVVTSRGDTVLPAQETHRGVAIRRVRGTRSGARGVGRKAVDFATFYGQALWHVFRLARRDTIIVSLTDPPLLGVGLWLVARLRRARLIHWAQDIYPELAVELAGARWLRIVRPLRDAAWRAADACVTLGYDMMMNFATAGVPAGRCHAFPNWAPAGVTPLPAGTEPLRAEWGLAGRFVVAYSGNLGRVHDLDPVLDVAEAMRGDPNVRFVFIGDGAQRSALEIEARRRDLSNVSFHPPQPRARLAAALAVGDLHLVTVRPGCERLVFPSKLYGIAAAGRPVLFIGPPECEIARIVREGDFGETASRDQINEMAGIIRKLAADPQLCARLGAAAVRFAAANDAAAAADRWHHLMETLEGHPKDP